jgi:eukaryotic-like serine/threonine-protein kinase
MSSNVQPQGRTETVVPRAARTPARPFVGRDQELDELSTLLDDAAEGRGSLVLVTGEPGIGKTRLMEELAGLAAGRGWTRLFGRCWEEGGAPAYWPWIQVVRAAGAEFDRLAASGSETVVDPEAVRFRLFDEVTKLLGDAARERRLLVVLDDLHAADAPSLLLLRFLSERVAGSTIFVVGAYRPGEARVHDLADLFAELVRVGRRIPLRELSVADVESYVTVMTGDLPARPVVARLHQITGGNPFFLGEMVRLLAVDGRLPDSEAEVRDPLIRLPEEVRALIRRRVAGLSREAVSTLRVAAVVGREFELPILQRAVHLSPPRLVDVLSETVAAGVVASDAAARRYSFAHELVRETLYEDLPAARRLELHLTIGRALEELHRHDLESHLSEIAHHLALAAPLGDPDTAVDYLVRAGDRSAAVLAYEEAAVHYQRALGLLGTLAEPSAERRCELLVRLGDAQWRSGETKGARSSFEEAIAAARRLGAAELHARAARGYVDALGGFILFARFEAGATGADVLEEALALLPEQDSPLRARLLACLAVELYSVNEPVERRVAISGEALEMARRLGDSEALGMALHARHWALATPDLVHERLAHTGEMLRVADEVSSRELAFLAHNARFHCFLELCEGRGMDAEIGAMAELAELMRQPFYRWHVVCLRTVRATLAGRFADAERLASEALAIAGLRHSEFASYVYRYAQLLAIRWAQGRLGEIWKSIDHHADRFPWIPRWRDALAAAASGDERAARAELERHAGGGFEELHRDGLWVLHLCALAEACVLISDERRGAELYELLLPFADRNAVSYTQQPFGPVALRLGMLAAQARRWEEAERHFSAAAERCDLLGARAIRARVLCEHARMLAGRDETGDRERAAELTAEARSLCEELGLDGLFEQLERGSQREETTVLRREGEFWTIGYAGETFRLRDVKGLRYIACLLAAPGRDVHALELVSAAEGHGPDRRARLAAAELTASFPGDAGPTLDEAAKEAYRRRLEDLGEDLQQARDWGDEERAARAAEEIDFLTRELAQAVGLGGRNREATSPAERARISVTKAIKKAITLIGRESPTLASHLEASIHTGRFCRYAPPGEAPPRWSL